jgi:DNA uptake protein ComE-like DNA-binding protein
MLRFEWSAFVTRDVLACVATEAALPPESVAELQPLIAQLIGKAGGLPVVASEPSAAERTRGGLALLSEAIAHTLSAAGVRQKSPAAATVPATEGPFAHRVVATDPVNVNSADAQQLSTLPSMTAALVSALIAERRRGGPFSDLQALEQRVDGIGPVKAQALAARLAFDMPQDSRHLSLDERAELGANLRTLIALQPDADRTAALRRALEMAVTTCAATPHPATRDRKLRLDPPANPPNSTAAQWVGELWSDDYWTALPELLSTASSSIEVCMFHIAAASQTHPTFRLLEALRAAHQRGVIVRVLLDSDTKTDPYHSTVINAHAKRFLTEAGIACRSDSSFRLLHSKFLVVDRSLVILGSHNWSAGSYFHFDDLTLAISSAELATQLSTRFEGLWSHGH